MEIFPESGLGVESGRFQPELREWICLLAES